MERELVTKKVKVHPAVGAAALNAAHHAAIKLACGLQVVNVNGEVEKAFHGLRIAGGRLP
jgi:hypothetical protein